MRVPEDAVGMTDDQKQHAVKKPEHRGENHQ